jgi:drug/metabolite transporter (DMT)-like permease
VFLAISAVIENDPYWPTDSDTWLSLFGLGIVVQSVGWWIIAANLPKIKAAQSGMILLLQPTLATVWGALLFNERLSYLQLVGAVITLVAIYVGSASLSRNKKRV